MRRGGRPLLRFGAGTDFRKNRADFLLFCFLPRPPPPTLSLSDQDQLHEATAAGLVLLRINVVVYLELGLVLLLCRSVPELPGGERETRS